MQLKMDGTKIFLLYLALLTSPRVWCRNLVADEETPVVGDGSDLKATEENYGAITFQYTPVGWDQEDLGFDIIEQNLDNLLIENTKGRQLMVFPEYSLTTIKVKNNRDAAFTLSQTLPDIGVNYCNDVIDPDQDYLVVHRLSCYSKRLQINLVANLVEKVACNETETTCSSDGVLLYNTNIAFDKEGKLLARYRKFNLLDEPALNKTDVAEVVTFSTSFGVTFGLVSGHDLLFYSPATELVNDLQVTNFVHPTAWVNTLPFTTGTQFQMGWSHTMGVNLVSSSYLHVEEGYSGAGVYRKDGSYRMSIGLQTGGAPIIDFHDQELQRDLSNFHTESDALMSKFSSSLVQNSTTVEACHKDFCCQLEIVVDFGDEDQFYHLVAYNGMDGDGFPVQACGLVACVSGDISSCGSKLGAAEYATRVSFDYIRLEGVFSSSYVIPSTLQSVSALPFSFKSQLAKQRQEQGGWQVAIEMNEPVKVHTFALYSHDYRLSAAVPDNAVTVIPCFISWLVLFTTLRLVV